jgi:hypothetical protein
MTEVRSVSTVLVSPYPFRFSDKSSQRNSKRLRDGVGMSKFGERRLLSSVVSRKRLSLF